MPGPRRSETGGDRDSEEGPNTAGDSATITVNLKVGNPVQGSDVRALWHPPRRALSDSDAPLRVTECARLGAPGRPAPAGRPPRRGPAGAPEPFRPCRWPHRPAVTVPVPGHGPARHGPARAVSGRPAP